MTPCLFKKKVRAPNKSNSAGMRTPGNSQPTNRAASRGT